jgi:hypothetical protein|tara:strand:- start:294 stop:671 length:378 start_codon:yes stop_codon:yes gene_type:complete
MKKLLFILLSSLFLSNIALAGMSDADKKKAYDCSGIYMANYFLPSGEEFEYSMKEKSMASVKVLKTYALEIGIKEKEWDDGVNKGVDKYYGSKYDKAKTDSCHAFVNKIVPDGEEKVKKVIQTLY